MSSSSTTFVTAFMNVYRQPYANKDIVWRFEKFFEIVETGIQLCVYVDRTGIDLLREYVTLFPNIRIMNVVELEDTWVSRVLEQYGDEITLPDSRNTPKDTREYLMLMHAKIEFLHDAIEKNPWQSTHFAWIDFNISHVFRDLKGSQAFLRTLGQTRYPPAPFLAIPGCWTPIPGDADAEFVRTSILNRIHWRFCGGFFLGDRASVEDLYRRYQDHFPEFVFQYKKLVWEVNFWSWLEGTTSWRPDWFAGDHNDSIVCHLPTDFTALGLMDLASTRTVTYAYPDIAPGFVPSSAAYVRTPDDRHFLNTRYVNYTQNPNGSYNFAHPDRIIVSKNVCVELDPETLCPQEGAPFREMADPDPAVENLTTNDDCKFRGMEDIRLFCAPSWGKRTGIRFIATSIYYSPSGKARMVVGDYDVSMGALRRCQVVEPPTDTGCEKNWIPVQAVQYIYQWSPMQVGGCEEGRLKVDVEHEVAHPWFRRFRGSTTFEPFSPEGSKETRLLGVVHFSEKDWPRHYFHALVVLETSTLRPLQCSQPFRFGALGIEFCVGFTLRADTLHFWISRWDRDPMHVQVPASELSLWDI